MKLRLKKSKDKASPKAATGRGGRSVGSFWSLAFAGIVLILLVAWFFLLDVYHQAENQHSSKQLKTGVEALVDRLAEAEGVRRSVLSSLARDPLLITALEGGDRAGLQLLEDRFQQLVPGATRVRLLVAGHQELDQTVEPHLSYASLQLLRRAEKSTQPTPAEVHQFATDQQHIAVAVRVMDASEANLLGTIHAAFPRGELQQAIDAVTDYQGRVEIRQLVKEASTLTLAENSGAKQAKANPAGQIMVANTIWEVVYWQKSALALDENVIKMYAASLGAALLLVGLLMFLQSKRFAALLKKDQASLINQLERMVAGKSPSQLAPELKEMSATLELLAHYSREYRTKKTAKEGKPAVAQSLVSEIHVDEEIVTQPGGTSAVSGVELPAGIFRAYDVRGVVGDALTADVVYEIGRAVGSEAYEKGQQTVIVGRDGRDSSPALCDALCNGLKASGRDVVDLGQVPTPVLYFATHHLGSNSGVMVTGSHNPASYNGLKFVIDGNVLSSESIQAVRKRIESGDLVQGDGQSLQQDLIPDYIERITDDVRLARPLNIVIDCGNAIAGRVAPELFHALGCEVTELFCEVDGSFPNHHPDPSVPENLKALQEQVIAAKADIGLAFDGDGDRLGVVDSQGNIVWPDRILMFLAADVLSRHPGVDIIYDVKSTRHLAGEILAHGGRPLMWKTGHSMLKSKMKETGALLAGEFSGHIIFSERWYGFDDALYAGARLLEILAMDPRESAELFADLPDSVSTAELGMPLEEGESQRVMQEIFQHADFPDARLIDTDGLRIEFEHGWGLVRPSNTTPALVFRFEADSTEALETIQAQFRQLFSKVETSGQIPF